jgi:flagellar hook-associated protein 2
LNIGTVFASREDSSTILSDSAVLSDAVNSFGATTAGTFDVNGTAIAYDADGAGGNDDTLLTLSTAINNAAIAGVSANVYEDSDGKFTLQISSSFGALTVDGDTGDLLAAMGLTVADYTVTSANINGAADGSNDGSVTVSGRTMTATDTTNAEGLILLYSGTSTVSGITLDYTTGVGTRMFFDIDTMLTTTTGSVEAEISAFENQNDTKQERLDRILERLAFDREQIILRFIIMETTLATLKQTSSFLTQYTNSLANRR